MEGCDENMNKRELNDKRIEQQNFQNIVKEEGKVVGLALYPILIRTHLVCIVYYNARHYLEFVVLHHVKEIAFYF